MTPRVDLVLYVNSANDARLSMGRVQALQKDPITVRHPDYDPATCTAENARDPTCPVYPLLVAVTSKGDLATKYLLPVATTLAPDRRSAPTPPRPVEPARRVHRSDAVPGRVPSRRRGAHEVHAIASGDRGGLPAGSRRVRRLRLGRSVVRLCVQDAGGLRCLLQGKPTHRCGHEA
ncbi:MAG: hypothetical protein H0W08_19655 [Acidobacteria bacterium]|nr:hypothetical protein [Acidobacteriota bacterium]